MLATEVKAPFSRAGWVFEPKYDGWRVVASRLRGRVGGVPTAIAETEDEDHSHGEKRQDDSNEFHFPETSWEMRSD